MPDSFHPNGAATVSISATTASASVALVSVPDNGPFQVRIFNAGASTVFVSRGGSSAAATVPSGATAGSLPLPSGAVEVLTFDNTTAHPATYVAAITASGTATVYFTTGRGI